jgi:small conductance mechanosensitive channel
MHETISDAFNKLYDKLTGWVEGFILLLPNLIVAVIVFLLFYLAGKLLKRALYRPLHRLSQSQALVDLVINLVFIGFVMAGFFVALSVMQLDKAVTSLLAGAGIVGLAIGFAFQDIAANFISGVLLAARRPVQVGDIVETNDYFGTVININFRSTIVRTLQGQHVHIPNKDIFNKPIVNFSREGKRRIDLECGISYGDDLEKVRQVVLEAIQKIPYLDQSQEITFFYKEFGDSSINFVVRYWVKFMKQPDYLTALSDGIILVKKAFDANDITIPFPIRTLDFGIKGGEKLTEQLATIQTNGKP